MISLVAMSIDAILPALPAIASDLATSANDVQLVVSVLMLGLGLGGLAFGPASDAYGRKPPVYAGLGLFLAGCLVSAFATSLTAMLVGRFMQGFGAAAPRVVAIAMVRDRFEGEAMARIMSFVMSVFILVPALAPSLGQAILLLSQWRGIFGTFFAIAVTVFVWFALRQPESVRREDRRPLTLGRLAGAAREVVTTRAAIGYTVATGFVFAPFIGYLSSSQQVFDLVYGQGRWFTIWFGLLALAIGAASLTNGRMVMRFGTRVVSRRAATTLAVASVGFAAVTLTLDGRPPFWAFMTYFVVAFFCNGLLFGNLNALAMQPLGHIAGIGASIVGALSMLISAPAGIVIGRAFDGTSGPLVIGFALFALLTRATMGWAEPGNR